MVINILILLAAFVMMEGVAWFTHKYVMHGFLWSLHKSHHQPHKGFELNDLFGIFFAGIAIWLIWLGFDTLNYLFWAGLGITAYGFAYFIFHDVLVHRRMDHNLRPENSYLKKITRAHKIHHKNQNRKEGKFFGFLFVKNDQELL
ncbi:MAG: sterol desaturase family protein [Cytophagaceae bacterium]